MGEIRVKYEVRDQAGKVLEEHTTYSDPFATVEEAEEWLYEEGDNFTQACNVDSKAIGGDNLADDLLIVKINGFPVIEEEVIA